MFIKTEYIKAFASVIRDGGIGLFPFDTIWGLTSTLDPNAVARITQLKSRETPKPMIIMIRTLKDLLPYVQPLESYQHDIIKRVWPGPTTLIFKKTDAVPDFVTAGKDTVAVRVPMYWPVNMMIHEVGQPIVSTSANITKQSIAQVFEEIPSDIRSQVDVSYTHNNPGGGQASAIYDCTVNPPIKLR